MDRRPIKSRGAGWAVATAGFLARRGVRPNFISVMSIVFAAAAAGQFALMPLADASWQQIVLLVGAAVCVQLRLLCNLFDGMVAVEGGFKTPSGELFNDFPDRISDSLILIGAGCCMGPTGWLPVLGLVAALGALMTAYTRTLGAAVGTGHCFVGPMAKPHRMAVVTVASLLSIFECMTQFHGYVLAGALAVVVLGCVVTVIRRLRRIGRQLNEQAKEATS